MRPGRLPPLFASWLALIACTPASSQPLRIGFVDPTARPMLEADQGMPPRNAAAWAFAVTQGAVTRIAPTASGAWLAADGRPYALEEFDVIWCHEGDNPGAWGAMPASLADLAAYLEGGGAVLLSGAAGALLHAMGVEPTAPRVLGPTSAPYASGLVVPAAHHSHPVFEGLDTSGPIILTSLGGNALADFYATEGPHGELLADGNAGLGERPLVEYAFGAGRALFVGWRLPDFTTRDDQYRPNLERLFTNMLHYLAGHSTNRGWLAAPVGEAQYIRVLGVPFLRSAEPAHLSATITRDAWAVTLSLEPRDGASLQANGLFVNEMPVAAGEVRVDQVLALTLLTRERPASAYRAAREAEQAADDRYDRELTAGLKVLRPPVETGRGPVSPRTTPDTERSVLLGRSPFMAPGDGRGGVSQVYEPIEDGGFSITGSLRTLNRPILEHLNRVWTGDAPLFRMDTLTGQGCYTADRIFPLWPRPDAAAGNVDISLGTLRVGAIAADGAVRWFDEIPGTTATFRPGYTSYQVATAEDPWKCAVLVAPAPRGNGLVASIRFDRPTRLAWQFGGVWWQASGRNENHAQLHDGRVRITEPNLPNGVSLAGWDAEGEATIVTTPHGEEALFRATAPRTTYHIAATWGVTEYDHARAEATRRRLDTWATAGWRDAGERLKREWFDGAIRPALEPERRLEELLADPAAALADVVARWDRRRSEFQIRTPDAHLNALVNWVRCTSDYHRQGPGLVLGTHYWQMYSHISTGWYGKQWAGDHQTIQDSLRLYGAMQSEDGFVRWISPSLAAFEAENNTPYWVDQVWWHYAWTGDADFVHDLWPSVRKAVQWQRARNDPDGDGLFRDWYEYWNCDSNGKGPKAAAPSSMSWAMLDRAARLAAVVGDSEAEREYRALADRSRERIMAELWREDAGRLGSIGGDGIWRGHPQIWEEYLAINAGLLSQEQGRRAMRWLESHYGFEPQPGIKLLACSDWYPIRWSCQWVPTGDTCLAALAGMRCGDADLWWPYLRTVVLSAFRSEFPGVNMGISNQGAGGGDREDVDSVDPHLHVAVRGLFGVEPAIHEGRLDIAPAFPADWTEASITTPDLAYEYRRAGNLATFHIRTPKPLVKRVRVGVNGEMVTTPAEQDSVVTVRCGEPVPPPEPGDGPLLRDLTGDELTAEERSPRAPLSEDARKRQVLFDLAGAYNQTVEQFSDTQFVFDYADHPTPLSSWWGNPRLTMGPQTRALRTPGGVVFLTAGRPRPGLGDSRPSLLALSSWAPYPLPATAEIPVGLRCETLWLLLCSYVHPMRNYVVNGEVVLHYDDGTEAITPLVPPFNLDCFFQHFSLEGLPVRYGRLDWQGGTFVHQGLSQAHADALGIACDPTRVLERVELRATCGEAVLGIAGMTAIEAE